MALRTYAEEHMYLYMYVKVILHEKSYYCRWFRSLLKRRGVGGGINKLSPRIRKVVISDLLIFYLPVDRRRQDGRK